MQEIQAVLIVSLLSAKSTFLGYLMPNTSN